MRSLVVTALLLLVVASPPARADHPIEVQRKTAAGEYFEALTIYDRLPKKRRTATSRIAAGKSAWALGLTERAREEFEWAIRNGKLSPVDAARIELSRGIIEYQERRFQVAALFAERVIGLLAEESPLRSRAWMLWGNSLSQLGSHGAALTKFEHALEGAESEATAEVHFELGSTHLRLGQLAKAKEHFELIPIGHERTPEAIRHLAHLALEMDHASAALFWLNKGQSEYPDAFLDSWVDYAMVKAAHAQEDYRLAREIRMKAREKYPPSDSWLILLEAVAERGEWKAQLKYGVQEEAHAAP